MVVIGTADGSRHEVLRAHVGNETAVRDWQRISVPLDAFAGQAVTLTLSTEPGPRKDSTGDWAGFETPRIMRRP